MAIDAINPVSLSEFNLSGTQNSTSVFSIEQNNFLEMIVNKIDAIDGSIKKSDSLIEAYIRGDEIPVHDVMIALGKSKTELQLAVEIRNKLLESYQEITRIQL